MSGPVSRLTGAALAVIGACLALAAITTVLLLSSVSSSAAASTPASSVHAWTVTGASARVASATVISARRTSIGTILLGTGNETLFAFTRDGRDRDACAEVHGCLSVWPAVVAHGHVTAGPGVRDSLLGSILVHGERQITYAGHPLYSFTGIGGPADTSYVGTAEFGGSWPALSPAGRLVH